MTLSHDTYFFDMLGILCLFVVCYHRAYSSVECGMLHFPKCPLSRRNDMSILHSSPLTPCLCLESSPPGWTPLTGCRWGHRPHEPTRTWWPRSCRSVGRSVSWSLFLTGRCWQLREKQDNKMYCRKKKDSVDFYSNLNWIHLNSITFGNNKLHISSQPLSFYGPRTSVPALILKPNLFQTSRLIPGQLRRWGWRERGRKAAGSRLNKKVRLKFLPE